MGDTPRFTIEPLGSHHDRAAFSCGKPTLDNYLRRQAGQDRKRDLARIFVALGADEREIAGYYSLSSLSIDIGDLPAERARKLPRYPVVPAALLGRLAVATGWQGAGLGKILLADALGRLVVHGMGLAIHAIVVEPLDEEAEGFYRKFGFLPFPERKDRLFLPMATVRQLFPPGD